MNTTNTTPAASASRQITADSDLHELRAEIARLSEENAFLREANSDVRRIAEQREALADALRKLMEAASGDASLYEAAKISRVALAKLEASK